MLDAIKAVLDGACTVSHNEHLVIIFFVQLVIALTKMVIDYLIKVSPWTYACNLWEFLKICAQKSGTFLKNATMRIIRAVFLRGVDNGKGPV